MFCPQCESPNPAGAQTCAQCQQDIHYVRERVFIGQQFIFIQADSEHPVALKVDDIVRIWSTTAILSRHCHAVSVGDEPESARDQPEAWPLLDLPKLPNPSLELLTIVSDRKIYRPGTDATLFIVAPDAAGREAALEIQLAGQKVYEAKVDLNENGLALHPYPDLEEGEYRAYVTLPDQALAECTFSVAEFTLSPLIATLEKHDYTEKRLTFTLTLLLLSVPYSGPVEFGLQCGVCGERVVATQRSQARDGLALGEFDLSHHGGPFHVQVTTPDGNTALVAFPGTGALEREHLSINPLGQTAEMGLLPWEDAEPVRGFYVGPGEVHMTPLMLESVQATKGKLQVAANLPLAQVVVFDLRTGTSQVIDQAGLQRGQAIEFGTEAPYTLFTVAAFTQDEPFEGWGIVIRPVTFGATLTAPDVARPGEEIPVELAVSPLLDGKEPEGRGAFCWLLVYDARLEHESPVPKLAKRIYESARDASGALAVGPVSSLQHHQPWALAQDFALEALAPSPLSFDMPRAMASRASFMLAEAMPAPATVAAEAPTMVLSPARMEFPELAYLELFYLEGQGSRTVKLGDQIGTWRVRAYLFQGADYCELTADVQADKPLYAELDLPAIASEGDDITAVVQYRTRQPADLIIATAHGETRARVGGSGAQRFSLKGPGRVEARLETEAGSDWTVRDVARPGVQKVTASHLLLLDRDQMAQGERVVIYPTMGQVLKDTIAALIGYPFG